jgi:hypothetical protein
MKMISVYLTKPQLDGLKKIRSETGLSVSEIIRWAIVNYIKDDTFAEWCQGRFPEKEDL